MDRYDLHWRYTEDSGYHDSMIKDVKGDYVKYSDAKQLQADNKRLREEYELLKWYCSKDILWQFEEALKEKEEEKARKQGEK